MDRIETFNYLKNLFHNNKRIVVPRYNDGEYMLMNEIVGHVAQDSFSDITDLLKRSIKGSNQLVCINYLKQHNIDKKDIWFLSQKYFMEEAKQNLYGCGNWSVYDFSNDNELLPRLFSGKVLLIAGLVDEASNLFTSIQPDISFYKTPNKNAVEEYEKIKKDLLTVCNNYSNILFSCGPIGKVLIADLANLCDCNLIDVGAVLNAILGITGRWPMSWVKSINLEEKRNQFFNKLKENNSESTNA